MLDEEHSEQGGDLELHDCLLLTSSETLLREDVGGVLTARLTASIHHCIASWRKRSLWIGLGAHLLVNNIFVLMMLASYLAR
ncbi:MAG: hypothetical protein K0Q93_2647 [Nocardioidaceae bacterium]|nr:hypothetical protein [Nocardioidaceae bacterium]